MEAGVDGGVEEATLIVDGELRYLDGQGPGQGDTLLYVGAERSARLEAGVVEKGGPHLLAHLLKDR